MRQVSLTDFFDWYEDNKEQLLQQALLSDAYNQQLREEFLAEWPLSRLATMSLDDYVIGRGSENKSFCYEIEHGKYKYLYMGIGGGGSSKFGIYWSKDKNAYVDQVNRIIPEVDLVKKFEQLKADLQAIVLAGKELDFDNPIFNQKTTSNTFFNRSAIVIKLLCIYSDEGTYFSVNNNSSQKFWQRLAPLEIQGGVYKQNYQIVEAVKKTYPDLDGALLGPIIYTYSKLFSKENIPINSESENAMEPTYSHEANMLLKSHNLILRGAPGTGKTYLARQIAAEMIDCSKDELDKSEQFGFVQFHPNYDYTDFVEGLRPVKTDNESIAFERRNGIFMDFCERAKNSSLAGGQDNFDEVWDSYLEYIHSTNEKEYVTKTSYLTVNSNQNLSVNYDSGTSGWSLPRKYVYELYKNEQYDKQIYYRSEGRKVITTLKDKFGLKEYEAPVAQEGERKPFIFVIDEINRGDMAKIFGELFFSLDPDYRGKTGAVTTQFANLYDGSEGKNPGDKFYIPENVYIIGTMNDIDRSVDSFDFAMRRRFRFIEVTADSQLGMLDSLAEHAEEAKTRLRSINSTISRIEDLNDNYHIGPSYFLKLKELDYDYDVLWSDYLEPLLAEYLRGTYEEKQKLEELRQAYEANTGDEDVVNG